MCLSICFIDVVKLSITRNAPASEALARPIAATIASCKHRTIQELIRRRDSERELLYDDNIHVEASAYAH